MTDNIITTKNEESERRIVLSTTVPEWLDDKISEMAQAMLVNKSVFLRMLLLNHVRDKQAEAQ